MARASSTCISPPRAAIPGSSTRRLTDLGHAQAAEAARSARRTAGHADHHLAVHPCAADRRAAGARAAGAGRWSIRSCGSDMRSPATSARRAPNWSAHGRSMTFPGWTRSGGRRSRSLPRRCRPAPRCSGAELAALPDWSDTVVVSHWGFILCLTGQSVMNGACCAATRKHRRRRSSSGAPDRRRKVAMARRVPSVLPGARLKRRSRRARPIWRA